MKMGTQIILTAAVAALVIGLAAGDVGKTADNTGGDDVKTATENKKKVDFDTVTLSIGGSIASTWEYELKAVDGGAEISYYDGMWKFRDDIVREDCLEQRAAGGKELYDKLAVLLAECDIPAWDGFSESDPMVLDGYTFNFSADLASSSIHASGCNAYPDNYRKFRDTVQELLEEYQTFPEK